VPRGFSASEIRARFISDVDGQRQKQPPTTFTLNLSFCSRLFTSASTVIRQSNVAPETTSIKLSIPKPTREMLPEAVPATIAIKHSKLFHAIVKYDSHVPRLAMVWRSNVASNMDKAYQAPLRFRGFFAARSAGEHACKSRVSPAPVVCTKPLTLRCFYPSCSTSSSTLAAPLFGLAAVEQQDQADGKCVLVFDSRWKSRELIHRKLRHISTVLQAR
jgi:hypothetical protein